MIDLDYETTKQFSTQEVYNIVSRALEIADDEGMLNSFVFERALYVLAAATAYEERTNDILEKVPEFPQLWDELVADGTIEDLKNNYKTDLAHIAAVGSVWFGEYDKHIHSSYAIVNAVTDIIQSFVTNFQNQVDGISKNEEISQLLETAAQWGINNDSPAQEAAYEQLLKDKNK